MKLLWTAFLIQLTGVTSDRIYHSLEGKTEPNIPIPHYITMVGVLLGLVFSIRILLKHSDKSLVKAIPLAGILIHIMGLLWDNVFYHAHGLEPGALSLPHLTGWIGFFIYSIGVLFLTFKIVRNTSVQA